MPVLNEVGSIALAAEALAPLLARGAELIIVDGESSDCLLAWALVLTKIPGVQLMTAPRGRAFQMNKAVQKSKNEMLLFLNANTLLPLDADILIQQALTKNGCVWGRFDVRITGQSALLPLVATFMNYRSRWSGIATGDQAIFMTRSAFDALGGFPLQPLMEDIEMSKRLLKISRPACLNNKVLTTGRRWDNRGALRTIVLMWRLRFAYWRGVSAERLVEQYR